MPFPLEYGNDLSGATITLRLEGERVDKKALYTMRDDMPEFALPFLLKEVNGLYELIYRPGTARRFDASFGFKSREDYITLWLDLLRPLIRCDDWFMKTFSFSFSPNHIFVEERDAGALRFLYIPAIEPCSTQEDLRLLLDTVAIRNTTADRDLEAYVVSAIKKSNFHEFYRTMNGLTVNNLPNSPVPFRSEDAAISIGDSIPESSGKAGTKGDAGLESFLTGSISTKDGKKKTAQEKKEEKRKRREEKKSQRAGKESLKKEPAKLSLESTRKPNAPMPFSALPPIRPAVPPAPTPPPAVPFPSPVVPTPINPKTWDDKFAEPNPAAIPLTEILRSDHGFPSPNQAVALTAEGGARLLFAGEGSLPDRISLPEKIGEKITVGRYSAAAGPGQNDFEFPKDTKEVSRRHAIIERSTEGYILRDAGSRAGTYINRRKLDSGEAYILRLDDLISFGRAGAEYRFDPGSQSHTEHGG